MEEKRILLRLPYGELSVAAIRNELTNRQVRSSNKMLKGDLSELLRMTLEKTQTPASLVQLRAYEIDAIQHARRETLVARLRSRGVAAVLKLGSSRDELMRRLCQELLREKAEFERQNKENIPPKDDDDDDNCKPDAITVAAAAAAAAVITPEQRERMERNRKRALELQSEKQRKKGKQQRCTAADTGKGGGGAVVSITPIRAPSTTPIVVGPATAKAGAAASEGVSIEVAAAAEVLHSFDSYCTPVKAAAPPPPPPPHVRLVTVNPYATLKRTGIASPAAVVGTNNLYSPVVAAPTNYNYGQGAQHATTTCGTPGIASPEVVGTNNLYSPVVARAPTHYNDHTGHNGQGAQGTTCGSTPALALNLSPCLRCGDTRGRQKLCIVWNHSGHIQRERMVSTSSRWDQFRWDCCGRLDGQPCFVGLHNRGGGSPQQGSSTHHMVVKCGCGEAALLRRTRKPSSPNRGRYFFRCGVCKFFRWADEAYGLYPTKDIPLVAPDGVREWEVPYANPYGETSSFMMAAGTAATAHIQRKRLIAALLLQEMCATVQGHDGPNCNGICSKEFVNNVLQTVQRGGDAILWKLQPLTSEQMSRRFGFWQNNNNNQTTTSSLIGLEEKECEEVLLDLLEHSQLIKSIGIRYQHNGLLGAAESSAVFVDLSGLEGYIHA